MAKEDGSISATECKCMKIRKSLSILKRSGLENMIRQNTFDRFETPEEWQKEAKEMAQEFAKAPEGRWFLASGNAGCGKTHLCVSICRDMMLRGMETRYVLWREILSKLKAKQNSDEYGKIMRELQSVEVLYMDDFLKVGKNDDPTMADVNIAFELLNSRYNNPNLITVISTERSVNDLLDFDEATASRIIQRCQGNILSIEGKDKNWRLRQIREIKKSEEGDANSERPENAQSRSQG